MRMKMILFVADQFPVPICSAGSFHSWFRIDSDFRMVQLSGSGFGPTGFIVRSSRVTSRVRSNIGQQISSGQRLGSTVVKFLSSQAARSDSASVRLTRSNRVNPVKPSQPGQTQST
ncbi:uncharacterized protein LOC118484324 [Helianthus annuus]|uniref:uncharacterized protein LOC118484324 n=1 Tax=Helianthus annuus TaxID=4232 RepID=UPI0016532DE8|nr:uncharacterized protein LOC118484324 [Helianthus annuus]